MFKSRLPIMIAAATLAFNAYAVDEPTGFTINPGIGITDFDSSTQLDEDSHWSLGFGYRFDNPWALELNYASVDTNSKPAGLGVDVDYLTLGGLYHLPSLSSWKPFLSLGLGERGIDATGVSSDDSFVELGAGLKYLLSAKSVLRTDLRAYRETGGDNDVDYGLTFGYQYNFGKVATVDGDGDNDGVPDSRDQCPNTPAGDEVDSNGCTVDGDADNDGVPDSRDQCPNTPAGDKVDSNGCTVDGDADNDGVADSRDKCPNTPSGVLVDADGCPDDDDRDGVRNEQDKCPGTPAGVKVDQYGCGPDADRDSVPDHRDACPETFPPALVDKEGCYVMLDEIVRITLDVEFDFDSAASRPEHAIEVKKVADFMAKYPLTIVTLEGHTDSIGSEDYNKGLSARRAATIGKILVEQFGVSSNRVNTVGYGEDRPIAPNDTRENRQRNRRVVAEIEAVEQVKQRL